MLLLHMPSKEVEAIRPVDSFRADEPPSPSDRASPGVLREFLTTSLRLTNVEARSVPQGYCSKDEVIATYRFVLLLQGSMNYRLDGGVLRLTAGMQVLVPSWTRCRWTAPGSGGCSLLWVEFTAEEVAEEPSGPLVAKSKEAALVEWSLRRMLTRWPHTPLPDDQTDRAACEPTRVPEQDGMELEAELKATLARFWRQAGQTAGGVANFHPAERRHPEVTRALRWLHANHARPEALNEFYQQLEGNPTHFRTLFRRDTQSNVQEHLARLRMRRARFLLRHTRWPLKRISHEVGYRDAAYFSRHYRAFWGHPPAAEERI